MSTKLEKMETNLVLGLILAQIWSAKIILWVLPQLGLIYYCKQSLYAISRKTNQQNLRKWWKKA